MPVRSLSSPVLKWPERRAVKAALENWAAEACAADPSIARVGYAGSLARGDWGVGSDLDIVIIVHHTTEPFARRSARWDTTSLPVPADLLVYTQAEWTVLVRRGDALAHEAVWVREQTFGTWVKA